MKVMSAYKGNLVKLMKEKETELVGLSDLAVDEALVRRHLGLVHFMRDPNKNPPSYLPISDPNYVPPTSENVEEVVQTLVYCGFSKADISSLLGLKPTGKDRTRVLRRYIEDPESMPYGTWRLMLIYIGAVVQTNIIPIEGWVRS